MSAPASSLEVRARLVEALKLDLVGPGFGHALSEERLARWIRPSNWYLTGFLIPSTTAPEWNGDDDEDDDLEEVPREAGADDDANEERKAAKKGFFPSSRAKGRIWPATKLTSRSSQPAAGSAPAPPRSSGADAER